MQEIWRDINGYKGLYQASNYGRIRSLDTFITIVDNKKNRTYKSNKKGKILKPFWGNNGYLRITLCKDKVQKTKSVHRLIAQTFLTNPNNLPQVNHIDGNKKNNNIENLEWCSNKYNIEEAWKLGLATGKRSEKSPNSKPVNQYDLNGNLIKTWNCAADIERELGYDVSCISLCCKGKYRKSYGFRWKYKEE